MAQQQESRGVSSRRSLTIAKQVGVEPPDLQFGDLLRSLPPSFQAQGLRQSNNRRSSNIASLSVNPTPTASASKKSSIPVRSGNSSTRKQVSNVNTKPNASASGPNLKIIPTSRSGLARKASAESNGSHSSASSLAQRGPISNSSKRPPIPPKTFLGSSQRHMGSMQNLNVNAQLSTRRSMSMDSLYRDNSIAFTPGLRTPGSTEKLSDSGHFVVKNIKPSSEKAELDSRAIQIIDFLDKYKYLTNSMSLKQFYGLSAAEYVNIAKFLGSLMMGKQIFEGSEDNISKILELANLLEYPGSITKSHFVCASSMHSRPAVVTFLNWLTNRVEEAIIPPTYFQKKAISEITGNNFDEIVVDSYKTLFFAHLEYHNQLPPNLLEDELLSYRDKVKKNFMCEEYKTVEELEADKALNLKELNERLLIPSPAQSLCDAKNMYENAIKEVKEKIKAAKLNWNKYKDLSSLEVIQKSLKSKLEEIKCEIMVLEKSVQNQPIDIAKRMVMQEEMKTFEKQTNTIHMMANKLDYQLKHQIMQKDNVVKSYYDICAKFICVEEFKRIARGLHWALPEIPRTPLEPKDLSNWIKEVDKIIKEADAKCSEMQKYVAAELKKLERNRSHKQETENKLVNDIANLEESVKNSKLLEAENVKAFELEDTKISNSIEEVKEKVSELSFELQKLEIVKDELESEKNALKEKLEKAESDLKSGAHKCKVFSGFALAEKAKMDIYLLNTYLDFIKQILDVEAQHNMEGKPSLLILANIQEFVPPAPPHL